MKFSSKQIFIINFSMYREILCFFFTDFMLINTFKRNVKVMEVQTPPLL